MISQKLNQKISTQLGMIDGLCQACKWNGMAAVSWLCSLLARSWKIDADPTRCLSSSDGGSEQNWACGACEVLGGLHI